MKKIFIFSLLISLSIFSGVSASDVSEVGTRVQKVQATTGVPSVPVGNDSKGYIGEIISKMFHATGMIKNEFITAFQSIQGSFANTLPKWDGQKFVVGTITDSGSNIGIGITNPTAKLHVNGNIQAGNKYTASYGDNTHYGYFEVKRNDGLRGAYFGYGNGTSIVNMTLDTADRFVVSGGKVGIETSNPQARFHIYETSDANLTSTGHALTLGNHTGYNLIIDNNEILARNNGSGANLYIQSSGSSGNTIFNADGGNVGIGINPAEKLHIDGNIRLPLVGDTTLTKGQLILSPTSDSGGRSAIFGRLRDPRDVNRDDEADNLGVDVVIAARAGVTMLLNTNAMSEEGGFSNARFSIGARKEGKSGMETWGSDYEELFTMRSNGRFGIGITEPTQSLDVNGKIRMRTQTVAGDSADIVATKGYVDRIAGSSEKDIKENGYYKNSDGLLMQWKTQYVASGGGWVNFPVKFDNVFSVTANRVFDNTDPSHCFAIVGKIELSRVYIDAVTRGDANCEGDINIIAVGK